MCKFNAWGLKNALTTFGLTQNGKAGPIGLRKQPGNPEATQWLGVSQNGIASNQQPQP